MLYITILKLTLLYSKFEHISDSLKFAGKIQFLVVFGHALPLL